MKILDWLYKKIDRRVRGIVVWEPCNVYDTAQIGHGVSIGMFTEVGDEVRIGDYTRIGMGVFIPKGVTIGAHCFIGPKVCFVHDMLEWERYPGRSEGHWEKTVIEDYVTIGANALIRPGVTISQGALIGLGAVVTRDVGPDEVWYGNPAKYKRKRRGGD